MSCSLSQGMEKKEMRVQTLVEHVVNMEFCDARQREETPEIRELKKAQAQVFWFQHVTMSYQGNLNMKQSEGIAPLVAIVV